MMKDENVHMLIAVYGNSYKTTTAVELAKAFRRLDNNASVIVIGTDNTKPLLPILFPNITNECSLGKLLSVEHLEQEAIYKHILLRDGIGIIGYNAEENVNTYAAPLNSRIDDFLMQMRHMANYTIIDCCSDIVSSKLTTASVINADKVLQFVSCDVNGLSWHGSQQAILLSEQYGYHDFHKYLTVSNQFNCDVPGMKAIIKDIKGTIPHCPKICGQWNEGRALEKTNDRKYTAAIQGIAKSLMEAE